MLQQTRVDTVIPYYQRFLQHFPDLQALATANSEAVLKVWEGLGYYSRVRNLQRTALIIQNEFHGEFPQAFSELIRLPGIGRYTAGAICSIAFQQPVPVVDGNVKRVLARLFELDFDVNAAMGEKQLWQLATQLLPRHSVGDFNQALMELGATVCLPLNPLCQTCPLAQDCLAKQHGRQHLLPLRQVKKPIPHYVIGAGLIWKDGRLLITRRREHGLLGGMWEFPGGKQESDEEIRQCVQREINEELGVVVEVGEHFATVKHAYTHFRITLEIFHCQWLAGEPNCRECQDFRWIKLIELNHFPFPRANKRVIEKLLDNQK